MSDNALSRSYLGEEDRNGDAVEQALPKGVRPEVLLVAREAVSMLIDKSCIFDETAESLIPRFSQKELTVGKILGRGGFCAVSEITRVVIDGSTAADGKENANREFIANRCIRNKESRYAIKKLSDDLFKEEDRYVKGVMDLALEVKYLAIIDHPHIIKMRAISDADPYGMNYFIVLDRLYDTLDKMLKKWKTKDLKYRGLGKMRDMKGKKKNELMTNRVHVLYDIASALGYLHGRNIVYRDLKPDNIAFDVRGDVKIFDFGLAKELRSEKKLEDGTYQLTGYTGSLRYMAPEVAKYRPYNETADVFSYAVLFWQIMACSTPYANYTVNMYINLIIEKGYRPKIRDTWQPTFKELLANAWAVDIKDRPSFEEIKKILREEICRLDGGDQELDFDISSRSISGAK